MIRIEGEPYYEPEQPSEDEMWREFIGWEAASRDTLDVKRIYIDMTEDIASGILLSQIVYWHLPDRHGKSRLRVQKEGHLWIAKARHEWWDECRVSLKQVIRIMPDLEKRGFVITKTFLFNSKPTMHVRINRNSFPRLVNETRINPPSNPGLKSITSKSERLALKEYDKPLYEDAQE